MVGASKILTVSYGTFSCTLEGFDDPFSTMKAIAEYFRDLAANDRFFGAEPPTPDVQMLHSIAQQNSDSPVDAKVEEGGLRLTQTEQPNADTDKPRRKKKNKKKSKKKRFKAKRAAAVASVVAVEEAETQEIEFQSDPIETFEAEYQDISKEVEEAPTSAFEMFLDQDTGSEMQDEPEAEEKADVALENEALHDDAISALIADETASTVTDTPDSFEVGEDVLTESSDEDPENEETMGEDENVSEQAEKPEGLDEEAETEHDAEDEPVEAEIASDEESDDGVLVTESEAESDFAPLDDLEDVIDESAEDIAAIEDDEDLEEDTSETVVAMDFAEEDASESDEEASYFTPVSAANRFAPVEQTIAEIEGLTSIDQTAASGESATFDEDTETDVDEDQEFSGPAVEQTEVDEVAEEDVAHDEDSNVTAFTPLEPVETDEAAAENMFTDEMDSEQDDSPDLDNEVAALFAVDEGEDEDSWSPASEDIAEAESVEDSDDEEPKSKSGLLSAASIAAKLQRIRAVVTSSVGGGDNDANSEIADEDALEENSEDATEATWAEAVDTSEEEPEEVVEAAEASDADEPVEDTDADAIAADGQRGPMPIEVSDEDLAAAAEISSGVGSHRPEVFKQTLESLNRDEPSSLSEEDEADLISQLAEASEFAEENSKDGRAILEGDAIEKEEEALERLLEQTNTRLNEDTTQRRQSALSHLKAAVAATIADRNEAQTPVEEDPNKDADSDYRNDLADIVRPKRVTKEERATNSTVAPLVLVPQAKVEDAEQDDEVAEPVSYDIPEGGVRPRRISRDEMAETNADLDTGFSDYAEQVGANDLKDLLEAAAAYLNKVEGKPHFSRPQVMHIVMRHDPERSFSREDSLRSFGELLRNGAIEKVDRGQFVISNESKFLAAS